MSTGGGVKRKVGMGISDSNLTMVIHGGQGSCPTDGQWIDDGLLDDVELLSADEEELKNLVFSDDDDDSVLELSSPLIANKLKERNPVPARARDLGFGESIASGVFVDWCKPITKPETKHLLLTVKESVTEEKKLEMKAKVDSLFSLYVQDRTQLLDKVDETLQRSVFSSPLHVVKCFGKKTGHFVHLEASAALVDDGEFYHVEICCGNYRGLGECTTKRMAAQLAAADVIDKMQQDGYVLPPAGFAPGWLISDSIFEDLNAVCEEKGLDKPAFWSRRRTVEGGMIDVRIVPYSGHCRAQGYYKTDAISESRHAAKKLAAAKMYKQITKEEYGEVPYAIGKACRTLKEFEDLGFCRDRNMTTWKKRWLLRYRLKNGEIVLPEDEVDIDGPVTLEEIATDLDDLEETGYTFTGNELIRITIPNKKAKNRDGLEEKSLFQRDEGERKVEFIKQSNIQPLKERALPEYKNPANLVIKVTVQQSASVASGSIVDDKKKLQSSRTVTAGPFNTGTAGISGIGSGGSSGIATAGPPLTASEPALECLTLDEIIERTRRGRKVQFDISETRSGTSHVGIKAGLGETICDGRDDDTDDSFWSPNLDPRQRADLESMGFGKPLDAEKKKVPRSRTVLAEYSNRSRSGLSGTAIAGTSRIATAGPSGSTSKPALDYLTLDEIIERTRKKDNFDDEDY